MQSVCRIIVYKRLPDFILEDPGSPVWYLLKVAGQDPSFMCFVYSWVAVLTLYFEIRYWETLQMASRVDVDFILPILFYLYSLKSDE